MSALSTLALKLSRHQPHPYRKATVQKKTESSSISEALWFTTTLALFLALGPFSAIATFFALFSLASSNEGAEPMAEC